MISRSSKGQAIIYSVFELIKLFLNLVCYHWILILFYDLKFVLHCMKMLNSTCFKLISTSFQNFRLPKVLFT